MFFNKKILIIYGLRGDILLDFFLIKSCNDWSRNRVLSRIFFFRNLEYDNLECLLYSNMMSFGEYLCVLRGVW